MGGRVSRSAPRPTRAAPAASALTVERIGSSEGLRALGPEWDRLQDACPWKHVLLDHRWISAWWRHFGAGKELHVLVLRRGGRAVGIAPMILSRGREAFPARESFFEIADDYAHLPTPRWLRLVSVRRVTFPLNVSTHNGRAHLLLEEDDPELYEAVLRYWAERAGDWDLMALDGLPLDSPQLDRLREAATAVSLRPLPHGITRQLYRVELGESLEAYLRGHTRHFRKRLAEQLRSSARWGALEVREYRGSEIGDGLEVLFALEQRSWKAKPERHREVHVTLDDRLRAFVGEVTQAFAAGDAAQVLSLTVDGAPVVALLSFLRQGTLLTFVTYLDDAYRGRVTIAPLWKAFMAKAIERGVTCVDFNGATENARKWSTGAASFRRLYLVNRRPYSRTLGALQVGATQLWKSARRLLPRREEPAA